MCHVFDWETAAAICQTWKRSWQLGLSSRKSTWHSSCNWIHLEQLARSRALLSSDGSKRLPEGRRRHVISILYDLQTCHVALRMCPYKTSRRFYWSHTVIACRHKAVHSLVPASISLHASLWVYLEPALLTFALMISQPQIIDHRSMGN